MDNTQNTNDTNSSTNDTGEASKPSWGKKMNRFFKSAYATSKPVVSAVGRGVVVGVCAGVTLFALNKSGILDTAA